MESSELIVNGVQSHRDHVSGTLGTSSPTGSAAARRCCLHGMNIFLDMQGRVFFCFAVDASTLLFAMWLAKSVAIGAFSN